MSKLFCVSCIVLLSACSSAPPPSTPSLTPENAAELLHFNTKAQNWITFVKKHDPGCDYKLDLPDQSSHPGEIDLDHIVWCRSQPGSKEFDASVQFIYDKTGQRWTILRFSS